MAFETIGMRVWGDYACFTSPETKIDRVSYDFPTPSSLRGLISSIFWKPEINWIPVRIEVLKPIRFVQIKLNEMSEMKSPENNAPFICGEHRTQRNNLILKDVAYNVYFQVKMMTKRHGPKKYQEILLRRLRRGECFRTPYLGQRQFTAHCALLEDVEDMDPVQGDRIIPGMLFDMDYLPDGETIPVWFDAHMKDGIVDFPVDIYKSISWGRDN